jgi:ABC-type multidrug transport system fused ATPase/permease subunit
VSSVRHADKIIVMEDGSIAEEGTHEQLMQRNGIYRKLYDKQVSELQKKTGTDQ